MKMNTTHASGQAASSRLLTRTLIAVLLVVGVLAIAQFFGHKEQALTPAEIEHVEHIRKDIALGDRLEGAIIELSDGSLGVVGHVDDNRVSLTVIFPNESKRPINALYLYFLPSNPNMMLTIQSITRNGDLGYAAKREQLLPSKPLKSPSIR